MTLKRFVKSFEVEGPSGEDGVDALQNMVALPGQFLPVKGVHINQGDFENQGE